MESSDAAAVNPNEDIVQQWVDNSRISIKTPSQGQIISLAANATGEFQPPPRQRWEKRNLHRTSRTRLFGLLRGGHRFYSLVRRVSMGEDGGDEINVLQAEREAGFSPSYMIYKGNGNDKELVGVVQCTSLAMDTFIFMVPPEGSPKAVCDPNSDPVQLAVGFQNLDNQRHMTVLIPEPGGHAANNSTGTADLGIAEEIQRSMKRAQDGENSLVNTKVLRTRLASGKKQQMNFGGRVLFASLKNVQLEVAPQNAWAGATPTTATAVENAPLAFQCGRRGDDTFACDFLSPTLSEQQAFALSIAIMVPKACFLYL